MSNWFTPPLRSNKPLHPVQSAGDVPTSHHTDDEATSPCALAPTLRNVVEHLVGWMLSGVIMLGGDPITEVTITEASAATVELRLHTASGRSSVLQCVLRPVVEKRTR